MAQYLQTIVTCRTKSLYYKHKCCDSFSLVRSSTKFIPYYGLHKQSFRRSEQSPETSCFSVPVIKLFCCTLYATGTSVLERLIWYTLSSCQTCWNIYYLPLDLGFKLAYYNTKSKDLISELSVSPHSSHTIPTRTSACVVDDKTVA